MCTGTIDCGCVREEAQRSHERVSALLRLYGRKDMRESDRELLLDVANEIQWDDAIHVAAPWDQRVTLCGNWNRDRVALSEDRPGGVDGCWTCLITAEWLDENLAFETPASSTAGSTGEAFDEGNESESEAREEKVAVPA